MKQARPPIRVVVKDVSFFQVFDRSVKRLQKDRAATRNGGGPSRLVDYVREEVADRMAERFMVGGPSTYTFLK